MTGRSSLVLRTIGTCNGLEELFEKGAYILIQSGLVSSLPDSSAYRWNGLSLTPPPAPLSIMLIIEVGCGNMLTGLGPGGSFGSLGSASRACFFGEPLVAEIAGNMSGGALSGDVDSPSLAPGRPSMEWESAVPSNSSSLRCEA